jgi:glyceraldehyde 3-phosphate dehydrogenase
MTTKVAINGLGRIGRAILKLTIDEPALEVLAVNDLVDVENLAYLLRFDTVYGRYAKRVSVEGDDLVVAGRRLRTLQKREPLELPWRERSGQGAKHRLLRKLYDELHYSHRRSRWPAHRLQ